MHRRAFTNTEWHLTTILLIGVWVTSCAEKGPVAAPDASFDVPALDAPALDAPVLDAPALDAPSLDVLDEDATVPPEDTWIPDVFAWSRVDAMAVDIPPRPDIPPVPTDVPTCVSQSVVECICPDGRSGLQPCTEFGYYAACRCVAAPPPPGSLGPRLLRPFSGLRSMTQRPTFRWVLPADVTRARIELCGDRACTRRITQAEVTGSSWRPADTLPPGVVFWRVFGLRADGSPAWTSATWEVGIRHRDTPIDSAWGPLKDFNGDGLDDLIAIAYRTPNRDQNMAGATPGIYIMPGNRTTLLGEQLTISSELEVLGRRIAIGDVNGDGLADLAMAAISPGPGSVSIYHGLRDGILGERAVLLSGDTDVPQDYASAIAITDFDGDGFGDLIVIGAVNTGDTAHPNVWLYPGSASGIRASSVHAINYLTLAANRNEDHHATEVGDLDGDGFGDFVKVIFDGSSVIGYGNPAGVPDARVVAGEFANFRAGRRTGMFSMDLDGDGVPDLAMGYPRRIALGHHGSLIRVQESGDEVPSGERLQLLHDRSRISRLADYDGDGRADIIETLLCAPGFPSTECGESSVRLFRGRDGFLPLNADWRADATTSTFAGSPGDINGDGFDDLVVADGRQLTVYLGGTTGLVRQSATFTTAAPIQHSSLQPLL